jgi:cytochrome c553
MRSAIYLAFAILGLAHPASGQAVGPEVEHFEKRVRPLLVEHCVRCHGPEKQKGGLRLDSAAALKRGGETGPAMVPGKPEASLLVEVVRYSGDLKMPPKGKLPEADLAAIAQWVGAGAPWPGDAPTTPSPIAVPTATSPAIAAEQKAFWAFQPVVEPPPPSVQDEGWIRSPIDRFILAGLEAKSLRPAPAADRRTLIRRATFDLTGLPPTPDEVAAFLADESPDAFERAVDRLLGLPAYGERWGRFWLDLARYADSNGMDENVAYAQAWRYRDYVVAAFNKDKPYDRFLQEQIAGDLLPAADEPTAHAQSTGTGFLVLGPKMLAEDDPVKMEMDIIDEQVDTVGKVFLGLTLGCARCHDHKFDPLPTADYYSLAGIFKSTKSMQNYKVVAMWNEKALASPEQKRALDEHMKRVAAKNDEIRKASSEARAVLKKEVRSRVADYLEGARILERSERLHRSILAEPSGPETPGLIVREAESFNRGNVGIFHDGYGEGIGVILNVGTMPNFAEYDIEVPDAGLYQLELRYAAADSRPVRVTLAGTVLGSEIAGPATGSWGPGGQKWIFAGLASLPGGKTTLRIDRESGPIPHFDKVALVPRPVPEGLAAAELVESTEALCRRRGLNLKLVERWKTALAKAKADPNSLFHLWLLAIEKAEATKPAGEPVAAILARLERDPRPGSPTELATRYQALFDEAGAASPQALESDKVLAAFRKVLDDPAGPLTAGKKDEDLFAPEVAASLNALKEQAKALQAQAPAVAEVMAVEEKKPTNLKIHIRGSHLRLGEEVPRRFLRVVSGDDQPRIGDDRSGRLELAQWMTRPDNPLTSRVMANRLWQWHFGQGIVRSPDNFGKLGERPTHPELLDWLARRFVESGWSMKAMHRLIMNSATYRMSTRLEDTAALADPDNRLRWRFDRRRLEAEAIRDSLLAVSGELDRSMGGTRLKTRSHEYVNTTGSSQRSELYDVNVRSVYLPVIRSGLYSVFQAFDFADPSAANGQRVPTSVAPQALFMMNDTLALRTSAAWAQRLLARSDLDDAGRVRRIFETAYGRPATDAEVKRALDYLGRFDDLLHSHGMKDVERPAQAWQALVQALLSVSEFLTID